MGGNQFLIAVGLIFILWLAQISCDELEEDKRAASSKAGDRELRVFRFGKRNPGVFRYGKRSDYTDELQNYPYDTEDILNKRVFRFGKRDMNELDVADIDLAKRLFRYGKRMDEEEKRKIFPYGKRVEDSPMFNANGAQSRYRIEED